MTPIAPLALAAALSATSVDPHVTQLAAAVDPARMQATVAKLVSFGTRHTLSEAQSPVRGIGAARRWLAGEFAALARQPGARLQPFEDRFTQPPAPRIPRAVEIWNVGAVLPGTDPARAKEAIVLTGHYDSRGSDVANAEVDAPGADDDGSGTALMLELARVLSREQPAIAVYFVAVAGEEQGLNGSTHLAQRLKQEGVRVVAMTAVDMIGSSAGQDGVHDDVSARLFSEGVPAAETEPQRKLREALGGENDGAAREWARYVKRVGERYVENLDLWLMLRRDRIARGSDHLAFSKEGFPAIRLVEAHEHWDRQHQDLRAVGGRAYGDVLAHVDFAYAARLGRALLAAVAELAAAPAPPAEVRLGGAVSPDTHLRLALPADPRAAALVLYRRRADGVTWQRATRYPRQAELVLPDVVPDNFVFAVATVDAEGRESLPVYPGKLE
ncbi:M20/M25/M40 family metallo-hydrolase [Anaeromyxobacter diazotrophicus]|uniref:Aminopeptidase n=1 Tax=Anaeromyxobacter diazotrophicus TaxID=2590199 RepID=A0A7I9VP53_9BACT|nr:M20/M25/M40 family metallo-hydrolase [Anaeromyxobacter diazotrophicus]GEJ58196.1 aminopeptidase [Anaeromyxobacter diazotrophicus]